MATALTSTELDEFDVIPDPFAGDEDINWTQILSAPTQSTLPLTRQPSSPRRSTSPEYYFPNDPLDESVLAQLDILDGTNPGILGLATASSSDVATHSVSAIQHPTTSVIQLSRVFDMVAPSSPRKATKRPRKLSEEGITPSRKRSCASTQSASPRRQRKDADVPQLVLTSYEDELTCPICCDIFVAAHLLNPCGHSFCGDCAWQWIIKNNKTGCPVCRTRLTNDPMTPNICMDKLVGVHIQMMGYMGDISWRNGLKLAEFRGRQKKWKDDVAERSRIVVVKPPPPIVWVVVSDDSEDDWDEMGI